MDYGEIKVPEDHLGNRVSTWGLLGYCYLPINIEGFEYFNDHCAYTIVY